VYIYDIHEIKGDYMSSKLGNKKVAANRGEGWKAKLIKGKADAALHPTVIKMKRVEKGISQTVLANELSVSLATYGAIERSRVAVKKAMANLIASTLGLEISKIFKKDGEKYIAIKVK
jgi:DNA-binding XRE family transcriptional regulator